MRNHVREGRAGERYAAKALEEAGMRILASNFRSRRGEVDLVAQDGDTIAFIEVKTWASQGIAGLEYSVGNEKQRRIIETAKYFLVGHREYNEMAIRFDVIFIENKLSSPVKPVIHYLASAFVECV
ncbi:MAG: YraN family protein [Treponema sp.]|nr:YraN family protein [Treponema sp.]